MATYEDGVGYYLGTQAVLPEFASNQVRTYRVELDFDKIATERKEASMAALAAADVLKAIRLPKNSLVMAVGADVETAEGKSATINIGDDADPDGYVSALSVNAVGAAWSSTKTGSAATAYHNGKYYTETATINVAMSVALGTAKLVVWAVVAACQHN